MITKDIHCRVREVQWVSPTVLSITFEPSIKFYYEPGQFIVVVIPPCQQETEPLHRCYSLATSHAEALAEGYRLLVRFVPGGAGSEFLALLKPNDAFLAAGPFGKFHYQNAPAGRNVVFVTTSTGIAPVRAIVGSQEFTATSPDSTMLLMGIRSEQENCLPGYFESMGIETIPCMTKPGNLVRGFWGRVTDFLERETLDWNWQNIDFYITGGWQMVYDAVRMLKYVKGVPAGRIFIEDCRSFASIHPIVTGKIVKLYPPPANRTAKKAA